MNAIITILLLLGIGFLTLIILYFFCICTTPPDLYPSDRHKWRIKEVILKRGLSEYYIQYKWYFIWRTYKLEKTHFAGWPEKYIAFRCTDIDFAKAKITELIGDRQRADGEKKDKVKYHYYFKDTK